MFKLFLLADDDNDDAELFAEALATINPPVHFHHVENGNGIFQYLSNANNKVPDIIFLDLNMPEMSGWQCLSKLKKDIYFKDIPVMMYSTSTHPKDKEIAIQLGAIGLLTKPSDYKILQRVLHDIVSNIKS
jgi:CheY-like chemotaxis protein